MRCYVESDGRVFLVRRDGRLDLPFQEEVPFHVERIAPLGLDEDVWFCVAQLDAHPNEWPSKDDVATAPNVAARVRAAVHATMPRVVVEGLCLEDGKILLVLGNRGLTKNRWTLPGGFLRFGETPQEGILREIREEICVEAKIKDLFATSAKLGEHTHLHWIMLFYRVAIEGTPLPNPDEIAQVRFVPIDEAISLLHDREMADVVRTFNDSPGP